MIPIKIDEKKHRPPFVTVVLIVICTIVYFQQYPSITAFGLIPLDFMYSLLHPEEDILSSCLILFTSFFLHGSIMHLVGNMWYLWLFGSALENHLGVVHFILVYLMFGIVSMLTQVGFEPLSTIPIVGASGAIAGIMGMYIVVKPFSKLVLWFPPLFIFRFYSLLFLLFWFWLQWINIKSTEQQDNLIAWGAHIGGFLGGVIYAFLLLLSKKGKK